MIFYGKSLGGFVVQQNIELCDMAIIDRSFWNISLIPRINFNKMVQLLFDMFISNFYSFDHILQTRGKVFLVVDARDSIVPLESSTVYGLLYLTQSLFFGFKITNKLFKRKFLSFVQDTKIQLSQVN